MSPKRLWRTVTACMVAFAFLAWQVATGGWLSGLDVEATRLARSIPKNRDLFEITVMTGLRGIILTVCLPWLVWQSWRNRTWLHVGGFLGVLFLQTGLVGAVKVAFGRSFPYQGDMVLGAGFLAFPSGHAANVVALWGWMAWIVSQRRPDLTSRLWSGVAAAAVTVAFSSWIIRTHWPTDLFAGFLLGGASLATVVSLVQAAGLSRTATPSHARSARP
ncbi:MAG: phosphatase PAP2 family protein [Acidimicrobiales bacterium]